MHSIFKKFIVIIGLAVMSHSSILANIKNNTKNENFYFESIDGGYINLDDFKGSPVLITNTASNCGFTRQYSELQKLHDEFSNSGLVVLAIPSQDFFQEFNDNNKVKNFCDTNFSLTLPMTTITSVKGKDAHPFFKSDQFGILIKYFSINTECLFLDLVQLQIQIQEKLNQK